MADATVSPLARAIRLGHEIRRLREQVGISQIELARRAGLARTVLSRIESPTGEPHRRSDPRTVRSVILALMPRDTASRRALEALIWDATAHGWWESQRRMGAGQQIVAAIECGASLIRTYQMALIPGLAQTSAYARYRAEAVGEPDPDSVVAGRMRRQETVAATGTRLEIIIEDLALRRLMAPPDIMIAQLHHLLDLVKQSAISVRVLPANARLDAGWAPTSPFSIYDYQAPDPTIVLLDVVGQLPSPLVDPAHLYVQLHQRLANAALSTADSSAIITDAADQLAGR